MKTLITALFAIVVATSTAHAEKIKIVNPGSEEGALRLVLTKIGENLDHDFVQANNPVTAYTHLESKNVLTVWSSEWPGNPDLKSPTIDASNLVALMSYNTLMCSRQFKSLDEMAGTTVKIATWGSKPAAKFLSKFGKEHNINFVVVPYDGSGSTVKGYIGRDADTIFTISSKQKSIVEDSGTTCFAFSEKGDIGFKFVDAIITVNADPAQTQSIRDVVENISASPQWNDAFTGSSTVVSNKENSSSLLETYSAAIENFAQ